jgi:CBS domain-containing protein
MRISEVMTRDVKLASPTDSLQRAAQRMEAEDFGSLPVGENDRLVGMLSDRDIAVRAVARGLSPTECYRA